MDLFRKNQKLIFWIVTIIIVPSFVLVWGAGGLSGGQQQAEFNVGTVNGQKVNYQEFDAFRKRLQSAIGGLPLQVNGAPGAGTQAEELWKYLFAYTLLQDADKAGVRASDLEVGTYLENGHPVIGMRTNRSDRQALERAVDDYCRQMQVTRQDLLRGIRDLQTIGNYLTDDSNLVALNDDTLFFFYAIRQSQVDIKRIRVTETDGIKEQATREIMEKPADQLETEARDYALGKSDDRRYRDPSAWRFAYILAPLVAASAVAEPAEADIQEQYENGKTYLYGDRPLEEVADAIRAELVNREIERQTIRNLTVDVDPQLRRQGGTLPLEELVKLTPLAKYGIAAAETAAEPLPLGELLAKLPAGSEAEVRVILEAVDEQTGQVKDAFIDEWKENFNLSLRPFKSDAGYFRLRLLDYRSSLPTPVDGSDGKMKPEIYELAVADMVNDRVDALVAEKAEELERKLRLHTEAREAGQATDAETEELLASLPSETLAYPEIVSENYDLVRLTVGDLIGPMPFNDAAAGTSGQELILLAERRIPTRQDFEAETPEVKAQLRQMALSAYRGSQGFTYTMSGPAVAIQPGPAVMGSLWQRIYANQISINPELLPGSGNEG